MPRIPVPRPRPRIERIIAKINLWRALALIACAAAALIFVESLLMRIVEPETFESLRHRAVVLRGDGGHGRLRRHRPGDRPGRAVASVMILFGMAWIPLVASLVVTALTQVFTRPSARSTSAPCATSRSASTSSSASSASADAAATAARPPGAARRPGRPARCRGRRAPCAAGPRGGSRRARRRRWSGRWTGRIRACSRGRPASSSAQRTPSRSARVIRPAALRVPGEPPAHLGAERPVLGRCPDRTDHPPALHLLDARRRSPRRRASRRPSPPIHDSASATPYGFGSRGSQRASSPDAQASTIAGTSPRAGGRSSTTPSLGAGSGIVSRTPSTGWNVSRSGDTRRAGYRSLWHRADTDGVPLAFDAGTAMEVFRGFLLGWLPIFLLSRCST